MDEESENKDELKIKVEQTALRLVNFRPRFKDELVWKLKEKKFPIDLIEKVVAKFVEIKIIDDQALIQNYINSLVEYKRWSRRRVHLKLITLHLNKEFIETELDKYFSESSEIVEKNLEYLALKKLRTLKEIGKREQKDKLLRFLLARGYPYSKIVETFKKLEV